MAPEDTCFWFQADPLCICVSSAWANRSSSWLVLCMGQELGPWHGQLQAGSAELDKLGWEPARETCPGPGAGLKRSPFQTCQWPAGSVKKLLRAQIQADVLGLKIKSCEVLLVWMKDSLQWQALEGKVKLVQTWREHWEDTVVTLPLQWASYFCSVAFP